MIRRRKMNSNAVWTRKCVGYFIWLFDWSNLLCLTLLGVVYISRFNYIIIQGYQKWNIYINVYIYVYRKSASRFSRGTVLNTLKQSRINIMRGKKERNRLVGKCSCVLFSSHNIYICIYIYTLSLSNDRFHKDVKPRYFLKNNDNYWWFQRNYCCIRGSFASILWGQLSMSSSVVLCWHAFSFRLSLSRRGGLQGRGGTTLKLSLGLPCWKFSP